MKTPCHRPGEALALTPPRHRRQEAPACAPPQHRLREVHVRAPPCPIGRCHATSRGRRQPSPYRATGHGRYVSVPRWPAGDTAYDTRRPLPPSCLQAANKSRVAAAMAPPTAPPSPPSCLLSPLSAPAPNHTPPAVATQGTPYRGGGRLCYHDPDVPPAEGVARSRPVRCQVVHRKATILGGKANYGKVKSITISVFCN